MTTAIHVDAGRAERADAPGSAIVWRLQGGVRADLKSVYGAVAATSGILPCREDLNDTLNY